MEKERASNIVTQWFQPCTSIAASSTSIRPRDCQVAAESNSKKKSSEQQQERAI